MVMEDWEKSKHLLPEVQPKVATGIPGRECDQVQSADNGMEEKGMLGTSQGSVASPGNETIRTGPCDRAEDET